MWILPRPTAENAEQDLVKALTYANGNPVFPITEEQKRGIQALYVSYNLLNGRPSPQLTGEGLAPELLNAVHDAFGEVYEGRRLGSLRERLKLAARKCPYCGFGEIKDLDHHLPRSKYLGFAIYAFNLIPCCHPCNNQKRAVAGENPDTQFHHTYLDGVPDESFLIAAISISMAGMVVNYSIAKTSEMEMATYQRLSFQFNRLDLNNRYQPEISMFITSQRTAIETIGALGAFALKGFLYKSYENSKKDFGLNHWQTALWYALSENDVFCDGGYVHAFGKKEPGG
jgi:hypothetical protein